ncbi:TPA: hypothetical protein ACPDKD_002158 [Pasteurella multocida]|uniref:hypothetical protein n=1 Tax=Pasteurella multocida TaxID=747 RepID=UPI0035F45FDD
MRTISNNPEALAQLQSLVVSLCQHVGVDPVILADCSEIEDERQKALHQSIYVNTQLAKVVEWAHERASMSASLQGLPEEQKKDALWGLPVCPVPFSVLVALLKDVSPDLLDDKNYLIHQTYLTPVLLGIANHLGNLTFYSIKAILDQHQLMGIAKIEEANLPKDSELLDGINQFIKTFFIK